MPNIEAIVRQINRELVPQFEARLREHLALQDRDWLIEQVVRRIAVQTLDLFETKLRTRVRDILLPRLKRIDAKELWIVTRDTVEESVGAQFRNEPVHFLTLPQFKSLMEKMKTLGATNRKPS